MPDRDDHLSADERAALDALIPPGSQTGHLADDLVAAVREAMARRVSNSEHGGAVIAALYRELRSWRELEAVTGVPTSTARRWASPPPTLASRPNPPPASSAAVTPTSSQETYVPDSTRTPTNPSVAAAITTCHLGVLVGQRNDGKPPWTFIAGKAHEGESIADAAVREVKEETGLLVAAGSRPIGRRIHPKTGWDMHYVACTPVEGFDVFVGDTDELAQVVWVSTVDDLAELMGGREAIFAPVLEHLERMLP